MTSPEKAAAQALVDLLAVHDPSAHIDDNETVMHAVLASLNEAGAMSATLNDEGNHVTLEATPLLVAIAWNEDYLVSRLAEARGVDPETIRFELREYINSIPE
jgi:hypothetical protein